MRTSSEVFMRYALSVRAKSGSILYLQITSLGTTHEKYHRVKKSNKLKFIPMQSILVLSSELPGTKETRICDYFEQWCQSHVLVAFWYHKMLKSQPVYQVFTPILFPKSEETYTVSCQTWSVLSSIILSSLRLVLSHLTLPHLRLCSLNRYMRCNPQNCPSSQTQTGFIRECELLLTDLHAPPVAYI